MRLHQLLLAYTLAAVAGFVFIGPGCKAPMEPRGSIHQVDEGVAIAFAAARTALEVLDAAEVLYLDAGTKAKAFHGEDDPALVASAKRISHLQNIRSALERVRQHLSGEVKPDLKQVLTDLGQAIDAAKAAGVTVPPVVLSSLKTLQEFLQ